MSTETPPTAARAWSEFSTRVAVAIAVMSVVSAFAGWRASLAEIDASDLERQLIQERMSVEAQQLLIDSRVDRDKSLFARFREHVKAARLLDDDAQKALRRQAQHTGDSGLPERDAAAVLDMEAQGERELARALVPFFRVRYPRFTDSPGLVEYEAEEALRVQRAGDEVLRTTHPDQTEGRIDTMHRRTWSLYGVAAVFVMSVFLLTLAEFGPSPARVMLARAGVLVVFAGVVGWAVTEAVLR